MSQPVINYLNEKGKDLSPLLIVTHNHADPDALASAWALGWLAEQMHKIRCKVVTSGLIGRMENQMMVKLLKIPVKPVRSDMWDRYKNFALVDTQPPFQNNMFPSRRKAAIVIDHHPLNSRTKADCLIIDEKAGATTTLLAETLFASGLAIPSRLATAMVYGIASETQNLGRECWSRDVDAYRRLFSLANVKTLSKIQNPPRPTSFFCSLGKAIQRAFMVRKIIGVHLGPVPNPETVAHTADLFLTHEKAQWSIVTGRYNDQLVISLRTSKVNADAGRLLWRLLGGGTSAGGHQMIAGGAIKVPAGATEETWLNVESDLVSKFLQSQGIKERVDFNYPFQEVA